MFFRANLANFGGEIIKICGGNKKYFHFVRNDLSFWIFHDNRQSHRLHHIIYMSNDRVYYLDTYVAGRLYGDADLAWPDLSIGQPLLLVRENDNGKDPWAVAVYVTIDNRRMKLGYIPLRKNQPLALFLDMGWGEAFAATISRLDPTATYDRQIGVTIRILRKNKDGQP